MNKLKVLISCYACSPFQGSEPGMGWNFVMGISQFHDVHVIVEEEKWKNEIQDYFLNTKSETKNIHFYFIKKRRNRSLRKIWPPSYYYFYRMWQKKVFILAKELDEVYHFDLIHQLNMVGFREPGYLWKINKPFVWGPIGGMQNTPWILFNELDFYGKLFYGGRNFINSFQLKFYNRPKQAATKNNSFMIAATPDIERAIKKNWGRDSEIIPEVGSYKENLTCQLQIRSDQEPLIIVWSGQHTPGKALNILLKSLSCLPEQIRWKLSVLGSGKMTETWKELSDKLGIAQNCEWYGWLTKEKVYDILEQGHLFCITSLKDLTSTVSIEALEHGLPIICLDHCGFSHIVNESCGIKIPIDKPQKVISGFSDAIKEVYLNEKYRISMAQGALLRANEFSWSKNIEKLNEIYQLAFFENSPYT